MGLKEKGDDYHIETPGERRDRSKGCTPAEHMRAARKADVDEDVWEGRRWTTYAYHFFNVGCYVVLIVGLSTDWWFSAKEVINTTDTDGITIESTEEWNFSLLGVSTVVTYCTQGECLVERDQFRYYSQPSNPDNLQWDDYLEEAAAKVATGMEQSMGCLGCFAVLNVISTCLVTLVLWNKDTRRKTIYALVFNILSFLCFGLAVYLFLSSLGDLLAQLEEENFVYQSKPSFSMGFSTYCVFASSGCPLGLCALVFMLVRPQSQDPESIVRAANAVHSERSQRTNRYFKDIESGTHLHEHTPVDSFHSDNCKRVGWTQSVDMAATNVLHSDDQVRLRELEILSASKDALISQSMVELIASPTGGASDNFKGVQKVVQPTVPGASGFNPGGFKQERCLESAAPRLLTPLPGSVNSEPDSSKLQITNGSRAARRLRSSSCHVPGSSIPSPGNEHDPRVARRGSVSGSLPGPPNEQDPRVAQQGSVAGSLPGPRQEHDPRVARRGRSSSCHVAGSSIPSPDIGREEARIAASEREARISRRGSMPGRRVRTVTRAPPSKVKEDKTGVQVCHPDDAQTQWVSSKPK